MGALACRQKIILNGLLVKTIIDGVCYQIEEETYVDNYDAEIQMVKYLNEMENIAFKFQRTYLEGQGFTGPWPHAMEE